MAMNSWTIETTLATAARNAVLPWKSIDATPLIRPVRPSDSQAQIDKCLSCTKIACTNCLHGRKSKYVSKKLIAFQNAKCAEA